MQKIATLLKKYWKLIFLVIYVLSPIDFIPEVFLGPLGIADDILVLALVLRSFINQETTTSQGFSAARSKSSINDIFNSLKKDKEQVLEGEIIE